LVNNQKKLQDFIYQVSIVGFRLLYGDGEIPVSKGFRDSLVTTDSGGWQASFG